MYFEIYFYSCIDTYLRYDNIRYLSLVNRLVRCSLFPSCFFSFGGCCSEGWATLLEICECDSWRIREGIVDIKECFMVFFSEGHVATMVLVGISCNLFCHFAFIVFEIQVAFISRIGCCKLFFELLEFGIVFFSGHFCILGKCFSH